MKNEFRKTEKEIATQLQLRQLHRDEEGRAILSMNVKSDDAFLSEFSETEIPIISTEVADFLENSSFILPPNQELALHIHSDCITPEEQAIYSGAIREYYTQRFIANRAELRRSRWAALLLGIAGILVLLAKLLFDYHIENAIWTEVIDIAAWVLIWESVYIAMIESKQLRIQKKRLLAFLSMKICYMP